MADTSPLLNPPKDEDRIFMELTFNLLPSHRDKLETYASEIFALKTTPDHDAEDAMRYLIDQYLNLPAIGSLVFYRIPGPNPSLTEYITAQVLGYVEGWVELLFYDESTAIVRPSHIAAPEEQVGYPPEIVELLQKAAKGFDVMTYATHPDNPEIQMDEAQEVEAELRSVLGDT